MAGVAQVADVEALRYLKGRFPYRRMRTLCPLPPVRFLESRPSDEGGLGEAVTVTCAAKDLIHHDRAFCGASARASQMSHLILG